MKVDEICDLIRGADLGDGVEVLKFLKGKSNGNFLITAGGGKYILRKRRRKNSNQEKCFKREANVLRFLEDVGLNFTPRSIFFNNRQGVHLVSYLPGKQIFIRDMSQKSLRQLVDKIYQINCLAPKYLDFSKKHSVKIVRPRKIAKNILKLLEDEVSDLRSNKIFPELAKWFKKEVKNDFKDNEIDESRVYLDHGDLTSNQIIHQGHISFIDWEFIKLSYNPGLAYIFCHSRLDQKKRKIILREYSSISGILYEKLAHDTIFWERLLLLREIFSVCRKYRTKKDLESPSFSSDEERLRWRVWDYQNIKSLYESS